MFYMLNVTKPCFYIRGLYLQFNMICCIVHTHSFAMIYVIDQSLMSYACFDISQNNKKVYVNNFNNVLFESLDILLL